MAINSRSLPLGHEIRGFRIEKVLGEGGFGITYLAHDVKLNRKVAIKEYYPRDWAERDIKLRIRAVGNEEAVGTFKWGLEAFLKEAQLLARFAHPNIVAVSQLFETNGTAYLVMDYCDGQSLDEIIKRNGPLNEGELERIWHPLLNGLEQVHATGFLHRDIKPANLYVRKDGSPVLLDFGSARQANPGNNQGVTTLVADGYSPIEQYADNRPQGPYTDIYGLGATLYRAVTGIRPVSSTSRDYKDTLEPAAKNARGRYATNLLEAIDVAMAVRPERRPQSIEAWRKIIEKPAMTAPPRRPLPKPADSPRVEPTLERMPAPIKETIKVDNATDLAGLINNDKSSRPKPPPKADGVQPTQQPSPFPVPPKAPSNSGTNWRNLLIFISAFALFWWINQQIKPDEVIAVQPPSVPAKSESTPVQLQVMVPGQIIKDCADCPEMVVIPAGSFDMGSKEDIAEKPVHRASVPSYLIGQTEVTQGQWKAVIGSNPSYFKSCGDDCPVELVSWNDAQEFARRLSQKTGKQYRLLSETEWEYAARAGSTTKWSFGDTEYQLGDYAWYNGNSQGKTQRMAQKRPNAFGLYDMQGNVSEWIEDCWHDNYAGAPTDGRAWTTGCSTNRRGLRGGSWLDGPTLLRSGIRDWNTLDIRTNNIGFRLARTLLAATLPSAPPTPSAAQAVPIPLAKEPPRSPPAQPAITSPSGGSDNTQQDAGPSASYAGQVSAKLKPNIVLLEETRSQISGNPVAEVEVKASADGSITERKLTKSSGVKAWDDAVLSAIDKTAVLPRDIDGRVPPLLTIVFSMRD